jgi:hypothetical protein
VRRRESATGLRQLVLDDYLRSLDRWRIPGRVDARERALESGEPVAVSSAQLMCALMHAGLPYARFAFGGADYGKLFRLDGDRLLEEPGCCAFTRSFSRRAEARTS